jgi:hypothetical protein
MPSGKKPIDEDDKWWNEWPLEGPENRWAVFITNVLSKSTRIIGWDDERIERRAMQGLAEALGKKVEDLTDADIPDKISFGLQNMIAEDLTKTFLNIDITTAIDKNGKKVARRDGGGEGCNEKTLEPSDIRKTELYKIALNNLQWQRDNYLVGKDYADQREQLRRLGSDVSLEQKALDRRMMPRQIPFYDTALGNIQLSALGSWFIPSNAVHYSVLPMVLDLPLGPMYVPTLRATANLIPLSQGNLDKVLKMQIMWILKNQEWRDLIKSSTKGYIVNTYVDVSRTKRA